MKIIIRNSSLTFQTSSSTARDILSHFSGTFAEEQKAAFGTFVGTLESAGLLGKITHMFLPILSSNTTECVWDAKTSTQFDTTEQLVCSNNELYTVEGVSGVKSQVTIPEAKGNYEAHIGYRLSSRTNTTRPVLFKGSLSLQPLFQNSLLTYYGPGNKFITVTNCESYNTNPHTITTRLNEMSGQAVTNENLKVIFDGTNGTLSITDNAVYPSTLVGFSFANCEQYAHCQNVRYRVIIITQPLTDAEALTINTAISTLMAAFFA